MFEDHEKLEKEFGGSQYLKWQEGETHKVVLFGDKKTGITKFIPGQGSIPVTKDDPKHRFSFAVLCLTEKGPAIIDGGISLYTALGKLELLSGNDLRSSQLAITKTNKNQFTASVLRQLSDAQIEKMATKHEWPKLEEAVSWLKKPSAGQSPSTNDASTEFSSLSDDDELPF